jgi:hypothetical protein
MSIFVNNNEFESDTTPNKLSELIDIVLNKNEFSNSVITQLEVDGNTYDPRVDDIPMELALSDASKVSIFTKNNLELTFEALDSCSEYIDILTENIMELVTLYKQDKVEEANVLFSDLVDILDLYIQLISRIHSTLKTNFKKQVENASILQELEIHLLSVIKAILPAKENDDIIMLSDLLEYELVDNLTQWKIKAIPLMKQMQNN